MYEHQTLFTLLFSFDVFCMLLPHKKVVQHWIETMQSKLLNKIEPQCIAWRRQLHQAPELGNREFKTAKMVADHLRSLGIEVKEGVAHTGVVGILKGGKAGPVVGFARRHGCIARNRTCRHSVCLESKNRLQRSAGRCDACLWTRYAYGDVNECRTSVGRHEKRTGRNGKIYFSTCRRRSSRW